MAGETTLILSDALSRAAPAPAPATTSIIPTTKLTGGRVSYYLADVAHPQREGQAPYMAECEDIIETLEMTPDEANIFKAIWRSAAARKGYGKPDHKAVYDAEKMVHYGNRILRRLKRKTQDEIPRQENG